MIMVEYQKTTSVSKNLQQSNSVTVTNENDKEISKERYIYIQKKDRKLLII